MENSFESNLYRDKPNREERLKIYKTAIMDWLIASCYLGGSISKEHYDGFCSYFKKYHGVWLGCLPELMAQRPSDVKEYWFAPKATAPRIECLEKAVLLWEMEQQQLNGLRQRLSLYRTALYDWQNYNDNTVPVGKPIDPLYFECLCTYFKEYHHKQVIKIETVTVLGEEKKNIASDLPELLNTKNGSILGYWWPPYAGQPRVEFLRLVIARTETMIQMLE